MHICLLSCPWLCMCISSSPHYLENLKELIWLKTSLAKGRNGSSPETLLSWTDSTSPCTKSSSKTKRGTEQCGCQWMAPPRQRTGTQQPRFNCTSAAVLKLYWKICRIVTRPNKSIKGRNLAWKPIRQNGLLGKKFGCYFCGLWVLTENYISFFGLCKSTFKNIFDV